MGAAATAEFEGTTYFFCCQHCRAAFIEEPARYAEPAAS
jgi:YHS domain-containing protein